MTHTSHLSAEDLAGYLDQTLPPSRTAEVETHLASCDNCRADLVAARRLLPRGPASRPVLILSLGLVAMLLLAVPAVIRSRSTGAPVDRVRGGAATAIPLTVLEPDEAPAVQRGSLRFIWSNAGVQAQYRITVTDSTGGAVWEGATSDTAIGPAPETHFARNASYFWFVDALLPDGTTRTSGTHRFTIEP